MFATHFGMATPGSNSSDTLACYPFYKRDPFVLDDKLCPHVLFSGNMDSYDDRLIKGENGQMVRLITIPKFSE